jgi:hypothetical protein
MRKRATRSAAGAVVTAAVMVLAGCSGGSSSPSAPATAPASPGAPPSVGSTPSVPTATSPAISTAAGPPAITVKSARALLRRYSVRNNRANLADNLAALRHLDTQTVLAEDKAYTRAGKVNGYSAGRFWAVPQRIAVASSSSASSKYFFASALSGPKPPKHGKAQGRTAPDVEIYIHTSHGWRLSESIGLPGDRSALPDYARTTTGVVSPIGSAAGAANLPALVEGALKGCLGGTQSPLVSKPPNCGELDLLRRVSGFHVHAHLDSRTWPTYTVALAGGQTLVVAAREITIRVKSANGVEWTAPAIIPGLLGDPARGQTQVPHGYVEHSVATVALVIPPSGPAKSLSVETDPLSASRIVVHTFTDT